jgi:hypothetical protein
MAKKHMKRCSISSVAIISYSCAATGWNYRPAAPKVSLGGIARVQQTL